MSVASSALVARAPTGRHFAQLYHDLATLAESVGLFIEAGLRRRDPVIVISSSTSIERFLDRVRAGGIDPDEACRAGQLVLLDAESTLAGVGRRPGRGLDWVEFRRTMGELLASVQGPGRGITRVYGDMVSLLWQGGRTADAIQLEEFWNALAGDYPFCLFCGYCVDTLDARTYTAPLHEIGRTHTDVLPSEEDERLRVAVDGAATDLLGAPLSTTINLSGRVRYPGEGRLPLGCRTTLWLTRQMPATCTQVLEHARRYA